MDSKNSGYYSRCVFLQTFVRLKKLAQQLETKSGVDALSMLYSSRYDMHHHHPYFIIGRVGVSPHLVVQRAEFSIIIIRVSVLHYFNVHARYRQTYSRLIESSKVANSTTPLLTRKSLVLCHWYYLEQC